MKEIDDLIQISQYYGKDKRFVIAGGGNTSYKNNDKIWVKASGHTLETITEDGFAILDRRKLNLMSEKVYSCNPIEREEEVKNDLFAATITKDKRPSVETSMHNVINYSFVVHLHPTIVNGLMCSKNAEQQLINLFGDKALYIEYTDPGYVLFRKVEDKIKVFRSIYKKEPQLIWLQNHGIFAAANTIEEVKELYSEIFDTLEKALEKSIPEENVNIDPAIVEIIPAIRMIISKYELKTLRIRNNELVEFYSENIENQQLIIHPFTPDEIVYCKSNYLFFNGETPETILDEAEIRIVSFRDKYGYFPKVILIKGYGLVAVGDNDLQCDTILDVFEDAMKIAYLSYSFGGQHSMSQSQIDFIDNWEVENYRRSVNKSSVDGRSENKTIVITGAAQGFGKGIAQCLLREGANIVVADLNAEVGIATVKDLNSMEKKNRALFVKTDISSIESLNNLMFETVCHFGAIDCFISNAGVLRAGDLESMTLDNFDFVTRINYNSYFYCTKIVSRIMKLQTKYASKDYYADIIQINSKSGLRGSKANFAYAGGKFGGIGLTQSFALELAPFRIKVNSVCPGNYYEGPLWSNPENGLFIQYLKAGKVPGAKTIEDVKNYYLSQVPMKKGCSPEDVTKAVLYLIEQTGETGQALPITGGQVMMS
ncbi:MAG: SDR family NAD(P)-dependent oxidoreductase [Dysgonamonadaceae bacterium]|jgi:NAD(P)-dependent dehydrogenase (short-subunit alcohol dehydrogenase family)/rhamnose utilization protein RhaD (predicted bifunctional aldolase and dehydrogenase)|nr:SDR family NAD(P)-dependent oxidoreductase [Dysgonamonadaceae bacterium]MDD3309513.1 SDR family NAD(P)-dependent oxidoreductase [Dysgonamonadaceae bacterium]MDD3900833.1 SDR family NAD(P)-dependent oxidoreductase [Dysgonamonadaceae bacterium]MDD4398937.1 SDR family NAD(P)-dependent oxidoreductase [Dysgonamonadaceae bacterium]MEA5081058.1 SDR family NAD(P)-dependent oxidoreductase [Dysgonamonadaceae bacterium]